MSKRVVHDDGNPPPKVGMECDPEGLTRQEDAQYADVNKIVSRASVGLLPQVVEGFYADVSEIGDYRSALAKVESANAAFRLLDARVRAEFANDPAVFLDAFQSDEGVAKLRELGVVPALEVPVDAAVAAVDLEEEVAAEKLRRRKERFVPPDGEAKP